MGVRVFELLDVAKKHGISLIAGEKGLTNKVKWFRVMETKEIIDYMEENLLLFITGLAINDEKELIELVKMQNEKNSSGTVVHVGRNIKRIPEELIEYCNDNDYPLFWVPWEYNLPKMMKDFSLLFIESERMEKDLENALKNAISFPDKEDNYIPVFNQYGFLEDDTYCMSIFEFSDIENQPQYNETASIIKTVERILMSSGDRSMVIDGKGSIIVLFSSYSADEIKNILSRVFNALLHTEYDFYIGTGKNLEGITKISASYIQAINCIKVSKPKVETNKMIHYEDIGVYKVLTSVCGKGVLKEYYENSIGILEEYDKTNDTNYKEVLRLYIVNNRSLQRVAETLFIHRNTVNYQITKIEKILECDLSNTDDRFKLYLGYCIESFI
jgi:predicted DNA-binding protein YlxM (UPF0122 family)